VLAIADDLTGALETAAKFAAYGLTAVARTGSAVAACEVDVVDTETRHAPPEEAARRVRQIVTGARAELIYKKTDSTLRGNIGAELGAIAEVYPQQRIAYVPAYPDMGRIVRYGSLYVHGKPVHETEFARDRGSPVRDSRIAAVLGSVQADVFDGECDSDIGAAAQRILANDAPRTCAGPAALAEALAREIGTPANVVLPQVRKALVVNGSLHSASIRQMAMGRFDTDWKALSEDVEGCGRERALQVGECVRKRLQQERFDAIVVFGGDTAFGIHTVLGGQPFDGIGEVAPGVAVSRSAGLLWITKAGGFGAPDLLTTIRKQLT
jgi:D-threonate/D-erythronate kinase